jgi:polyphosphate kinase
VQIDGVVRGVCTMRAGVPGLSENIRVRSVLGRFLEHSRIYRFGHGDFGDGDAPDGPMYLIGSADLMPRNLDRRVEVLVPVNDPKLRAELRDVVLDRLLRDTERAWLLTSSGRYERAAAADDRTDAQRALMEWYAARAKDEINA